MRAPSNSARLRTYIYKYELKKAPSQENSAPVAASRYFLFNFQRSFFVFRCLTFLTRFIFKWRATSSRKRSAIVLLGSFRYSASTMRHVTCTNHACIYEGGLENCQIRWNPFLSRCLMSVTNSLIMTQANLCCEQSHTKRPNKFWSWMQKTLAATSTSNLI